MKRTEDVGVRRAGRGHGDLGGLLQRVAVDPGRDGREGHRPARPPRRPSRACCGSRRPASRALRPFPPCQTGPTVWMMNRAARSNPGDDGLPGRAFADGRHAACRRAARPHGGWRRRRRRQPPSARLAALTTASTRSAVMSPRAACSSGATRRATRRWGRPRGGGHQVEQRRRLGRRRLALVLAPVRERHDPVDGRLATATCRRSSPLGSATGCPWPGCTARPAPCRRSGGDRALDGRRLLAGDGGRLAEGVGPADLELLGRPATRATRRRAHRGPGSTWGTTATCWRTSTSPPW